MFDRVSKEPPCVAGKVRAIDRHRVDDSFEQRIHDRVEQAVFVAEVVVNESLVRLSGCRDPVHAGTRYPPLRELVGRRHQ